MAFEARALTGTMLAGRYLIRELTNETALATRFAAEDMRTGALLDVDVVREGLRAESLAARSLELEAMTACEIRHPNVPVPRDVGVLDDGSPFIVTTRFEGTTLDDRICLGGSMLVADVVRIGLDILSALGAAHDLELVHGDLRPESVFLVERDGLVLQTLVSGFGRRKRPASQAGAFTHLAFVAPEVADGQPATITSDLYAVGALLYAAATGFPPYSAPSAFALSEAVRTGTLRTPSSFRPGLPARLVCVLLQALETDASRRFASARDMMRALELVSGATAVKQPVGVRPLRRANAPEDQNFRTSGDETTRVAPLQRPAGRARTSSGVVPALDTLVSDAPPRASTG